MVAFLKKAKSLSPKKTAKFYLHQHLSGFDPARSMRVLHASELTKPEGFCPRAYALRDATGQKPKDRWLTTSEVVTFQMGRDNERNVVNWFADIGRAVCHWKCVACGTLHYFRLRPVECEQCGCNKMEPKEVRFQSEVTGASCGVDMLLALGGPKLVPYELKSMDKDEFKSLVAPLAEHKLRTTLYLRIIAESISPWAKSVQTDEGYVMYVSKGGYGCADPQPKTWGLSDSYSPFKEYLITRDDELTEGVSAMAKVVNDFRNGAVGMPCGICSSSMSKRANGCAFKTACFSGDYPPEYDWTK